MCSYLPGVGGWAQEAEKRRKTNGRAEALVFDVRGQVRGLMLSLSRSWTL